MERDRIIDILREHKEELDREGVASLALFGSVARLEDHPSSDVDILVEFSRPVGLFGFVSLKAKLEELLGRRVDLVTEDALRPAMRERVLKEAVHAA